MVPFSTYLCCHSKKPIWQQSPHKNCPLLSCTLSKPSLSSFFPGKPSSCIQVRSHSVAMLQRESFTFPIIFCKVSFTSKGEAPSYTLCTLLYPYHSSHFPENLLVLIISTDINSRRHDRDSTIFKGNPLLLQRLMWLSCNLRYKAVLENSLSHNENVWCNL